MQTKSKIILWTIIVVLTTITVIGFVRCEHTFTTRPNDDGIDHTEKTIEIESDKDGDTNQAVKPVSLGEFKLTAYCSCKKCCGKWADNRPVDKNGNEIVCGAIGERLKEGYSIAVDPTVIPYRTEVMINGHIYKAQDCGDAIKGNRIDVYFENHQDALKFGVQYAEVFVMTL